MPFIASPTKKWWGSFISAVVLLANFGIAESRTVGPASADALLKTSDVVALVEILRETTLYAPGDANSCGTRYHARVIENFKGNRAESKAKEFVFGRQKGLEPGRSYFIFGTAVSTVEAERERLERENPEFKSRFESASSALIGCDGIVPGIVVDSRSAWIVDGDQIVVNGLPPPSGADSLQWQQIGDLKWMLPREDLEKYLRMAVSLSAGDEHDNTK